MTIARQMLGIVTSRGDAFDQRNIVQWRTFPDDKVRMRYGRIAGIYFSEIVHLNDGELVEELLRSLSFQPLGGMLHNSYLEDVKEDGPTGEVVVSVNNEFVPTPKSLKILDGRHKALVAFADSIKDTDRIVAAIEARLKAKYTHTIGNQVLMPSPYFALPVPKIWGHLYNNPKQPLPGSSQVPKVYAQHRLVKPTMYSGLMRVAAQLITGFGTDERPTKKEVIRLQTSDLNDSVRVMEDYRIGDEETPKLDRSLGSLRYWFHWVLTHGILKTEKGRYYLIAVGSSGIWAMRLPMFPVENGISDEAKEYFPSIPMGLAFPSKYYTNDKGETEFDAAVRQGWVRQIATADDMAPFYEKLQPTYTECGWAFSMSGRKIDNVGWRLNGPRPYDYPIVEHWHIDLIGGDGESEDVWDYHHDDGYDDSISTLGVVVTKVGQGNALDISQWHKPFKVPEIDHDTGVPGVVSFDMLPRGWSSSGPPPPDYIAASKNYPVSDTVVHVFYDGEELVWTRFYNPMNTNKQETGSWDDRDDSPYCMQLGGYTWGSYVRNTKLPKGFYSNRNDPRKLADESRTDMRSSGAKTWESPYMGVQYSWPYPPFHFGYEQSNSEGEWYNDFDASYTSRVGSPWTAKRHCFHVHVEGTQITGQQYAYSCAIPLTDREAVFICERHIAATRNVIDYKYATMVMQYVYYTYPSWIPDYNDGGNFGIPSGNWEWWQLRDDTVKYLVWQFFSQENNYTKEQLEPAQTVLNIVGGTHTAPLDTWDHSTNQSAIEDYKIFTISSKLGGEYPIEMKASAGASELWENILPDDDGWQIAHLWCTKSLLGNEGFKQNIYLNGAMGFSGVFQDKLTAGEQSSRHSQITFVGVT